MPVIGNKKPRHWLKKSVDALYNNPKQASYYAAKVIELFPEERQNDQKAEAMFYYSQAEKLLGNFDVSIKSIWRFEIATPTNKEVEWTNLRTDRSTLLQTDRLQQSDRNEWESHLNF